MKRYLVRRLLIFLPLLLIVSVLAFSLVRILPGDAALAYLQSTHQNPTEESLARARAHLGLDQPLIVQYKTWLLDVLHGNLGMSFQNSRVPVAGELLRAMKKTLALTAGACFWALLIGMPLGLRAASKPGGIADHAARIVSVLTASMPQFLTGFLLILLFSQHLNWLPPYGARSFRHYILPSLALGLSYVTYQTKLLRNSLLEHKEAGYVRYARARGLSEHAIFYTHVLRNSLIPMVTMLCVNLGYMIAGSVLVENVFSIPGMGTLMISSINSRDYPMMQGWILVMALTFLLLNLAADLLCAWLNPQMRYE